MGKKRKTAPPAAVKAVTLERAARLYRLLRFLDTGAKARGVILKKLRIDIRTFYRDLELLRDCKIGVQLDDSRYGLEAPAAKTIPRLPFPDPSLTLGEAMILAKGRSQVHAKVRRLVSQIMK